MPQFRVKNLMINVLPEAELGREELKPAPCAGFTLNCQQFTNVCPGYTLINCNWRTEYCINFTGMCHYFTYTNCIHVTVVPTDVTTYCPYGTIRATIETLGCPGGSRFDTNLFNPDDLVTLKEQLKQQLAAIEESEAGLSERLAPQSEAEIDELEKVLNESLEELKARRDVLRKRNG